MFLCETYNLTIGIPALRYNKWIITEDGKTVNGLLGKQLQLLISSRKSFPFNCKIINLFKVGDKLENGTYDGALGAIDKKEIDIFIKSEIPFVENQNVLFSYPVYTEDFFIYQQINKKEMDSSDLKMQLIRSFSFEFFFYYFITAFFFFTMFSFIYFKLFSTSKIHSENWFREFYIFITKTNFNKVINLNIFFFGFILLNFFTKEFTTNNVKTTKVIVDTRQFITTEDRLFDSPLKAAWIDGESDFWIVQNAPKNTFLNKLNLLKNDHPVKTMEKSFSLEMIPLLENYFFFMKSYILHLIINMLSYFQKEDGFLNEKPFYSVYSVFYITKNIDSEKIKFLYDFTQRSTQASLIMELKSRVLNMKLYDTPRTNKIYKNLNSYIHDFTKFDSLSYENFYLFFLVFSVLDFLVLFYFISYILLIKLG